MFGPNVKADERGIYYHHREKEFHNLLIELQDVFKEKFGYKNYHILFITGNGTFVNEMVINSFYDQFTFLDTDVTFGEGLSKIPTFTLKGSSKFNFFIDIHHLPNVENYIFSPPFKKIGSLLYCCTSTI